ncbi:MAG: SsrA-binding protein [Myxococcales bacterium]|nr:SsrA-binding protein [Myxococcales bacterium]
MSNKKANKRTISTNRRARHEYEVEDSYEAGLVLQGTEVKSLRQGSAVINEGYIVITNGEAWLHQVMIPEYSHGNRENHSPSRKRKLLLNHREIHKVQKKIAQQGYSAFALELYFKGPRVKVLIGIGRGKKLYDKRQSEKEKSARRELRERY